VERQSEWEGLAWEGKEVGIGHEGGMSLWMGAEKQVGGSNSIESLPIRPYLILKTYRSGVKQIFRRENKV
jgi:hypothetical protein